MRFRHFSMIVLVFVMLGDTGAFAHDLGVARVTLRETSAGYYVIETKVPEKFDGAAPILPTRLQEAARITSRHVRRSVVTRYEFTATGAPLNSDDEILLPWKGKGVFATATWVDGTTYSHFFAASENSITVPLATMQSSHRSLGGTIRHYSLLGIDHIIFGWDHLAFVLCLCLISTGWRRVKLVTAFTIGHSLTLVAAVLGLARLPGAPVEACIAVSILFVAREALLVGPNSKHGPALALMFGLLHGLGFASALTEIGMSPSELIPGLISFNVGVEVGQLAFVLVVVAVTLVGKRLGPMRYNPRPLLARAVGVIALVWTVQRVIGFAG